MGVVLLVLQLQIKAHYAGKAGRLKPACFQLLPRSCWLQKEKQQRHLFDTDGECPAALYLLAGAADCPSPV